MNASKTLVCALSALVIACVGLVSVCASHGQATLSPAILDDGNGVYMGTLTHNPGGGNPHPWYTFDAMIGDMVTIDVLTVGGWGATFWLYEVLDGNAQVGDVPGVDLLFLQEAGGAGTMNPNLNYGITVSNQYAIQIDSWLGGQGDYTITISGATGIDPTCVITAPVMAATVSGDVTLTFDGDDPTMTPLDSTIELSTDSGATWNLASDAPGSPITNPDLMRPTPFSGVSFTWDSHVDGVGLLGAELADLRVVVDNGAATSTCGVSVMVDNQPSCTVTAPAPGSAATLGLDIVFDASDPSGDALTSTFEFSPDSGVTWSLATPTATSTVSNPDPARPTPFSAVTFTWDTLTDLAAVMSPATVLVRITASDGAADGNCQTDVSLSCLICGDCDSNGVGPNIVDSLAAAQIAASLIAPTSTQTICCDTNSSQIVDILDALVIAQFSAALPVTLMCL